MNEPEPAIPIPSDVLDAIAERVADIVIERLSDELRPTTGRWMRTREAAEYLGLTRSPLYSRIGDVPHHKIDRLLLFKRDDLDAWLASHRREPDNPQTWVRHSEPILRSRPRKPTLQKELLPIEGSELDFLVIEREVIEREGKYRAGEAVKLRRGLRGPRHPAGRDRDRRSARVASCEGQGDHDQSRLARGTRCRRVRSTSSTPNSCSGAPTTTSTRTLPAHAHAPRFRRHPPDIPSVFRGCRTRPPARGRRARRPRWRKHGPLPRPSLSRARPPVPVGSG